jgi:hypothetical protein
MGSVAVQILHMANDSKPGVDDREIVAPGVAERVFLLPLQEQSQNNRSLANGVFIQPTCPGKHQRLGGLTGSSFEKLEPRLDS